MFRHHRWVLKYSSQLEEAFHRRKGPVWISWRMDETYIRVKGEWRYLYRAVDKQGSWKTELDRASPRPNSSPPWPRNPLTDKGHCPCSISCIKFATEPVKLPVVDSTLR